MQKAAQPAAFSALKTADAHGEGDKKGGRVNTYTSATGLKMLTTGEHPAFEDFCVVNNSRLQTWYQESVRMKQQQESYPTECYNSSRGFRDPIVFAEDMDGSLHGQAPSIRDG